MTDKDFKKISKIFTIILDKRLEEFEEKVRKVVRSEIEYALENSNVSSKQQLNDDIPQEKMDKIKESVGTGSNKATSPKEMMSKIRQMNEKDQSPNRDVYVDEDNNKIDMTENENVKEMQNRDYSQLI